MRSKIDELMNKIVLAEFTPAQKEVLFLIVMHFSERIMHLAGAILGDLKEEDKDA